MSNSLQVYKADKIFIDSATFLEKGYLLVSGKEIVGYEQSVESSLAEAVIDFKQSLMMPVFINAHTHIQYGRQYDNAFTDFADWVLALVKQNAGLSQESFLKQAINNLIEIVKSGVIIIFDAARNPIPTIQAVNHIGLRGNIAFEVFSNSTTDCDKVFNQLIETYDQLKDLGYPHSTIGISPHSLYNMTLEFWQKMNTFAVQNNILLHTHLLESESELEFFTKGSSSIDKIHRYFNLPKQLPPGNLLSPVAMMAQHKLLHSNLLATHLCYAHDDDIEMLVQHGVSINHCPRSNKFLRNKVMPLKKFLEAGANILLGTDSLASNEDLSIIHELLAVDLALTDADILKLLCENPAKLFHNSQVTGTLRPGSEVSFLVFDYNEETTLKDVLQHHPKPRHVIDRGRFLIKDYHFMTTHQISA